MTISGQTYRRLKRTNKKVLQKDCPPQCIESGNRRNCEHLCASNKHRKQELKSEVDLKEWKK